MVPDIATCQPNRSPALVLYAFGLSNVCTRAPVVTLNMYALPDKPPPASSSPIAPTIAELPDIATEKPK